MKPRLNVVALLGAAIGLGILAVVGVTLFGPAISGSGQAEDDEVLDSENEAETEAQPPGQEPEPPLDQVQICTLMACIDGATVEFSGDIPSDYHVDVTGSDGETWQTDCHLEPGMAEGMGCLPQGGVRIDGITPQTFTIIVTWDGGSAAETFQPAYQTVQPNGPNCEPTCQQADLTMSLP